MQQDLHGIDLNISASCGVYLLLSIENRMHISASSPDEYIRLLQEDHKVMMLSLREAVRSSLPEGFEEGIAYGMLAYYVPLSRYPAGYHAAKDQPLPFISIASQKRHIALYHMGVYADPALLDWFVGRYRESQGRLPDMGKSCIRFNPSRTLPVEVIKELCSRITVEEWIRRYEAIKK